MALKIELGPDKDHGPGFGILRIDGLPAVEGGLQVSIQSNQGGGRFLDGAGNWSSQEVWHDLPSSGGLGAQVVGLSPDLVDPIASLPANVMLRMQVKTAAKTDAGRVVVKDLLHSVASGARPVADIAPVVHVPPPVVEEASVEAVEVVEVAPVSHEDRFVPPPVPPKRNLMPLLIAAGVLALVLAGIAGNYFLNKSKVDSAKVEESAPVSTPDSAAGPGPGPAAVSGDLATREDVAKFIQSNPSADAAVAAAKKLADGGKLDLAMLVYQFAARAGSTDATLALAHMYDPETWSKTTSPMERADAETAAYWYEPAAQAGNPEAQRQLGKILVDLNPSGFQRDKGKEWLSKAAAGGDAKAKTLLDAVK